MVLAPLTLGMFYLAGLSWVYLVFFIAPAAGFLALSSGTEAKALWIVGLALITLLMRWKHIHWLERIVFWSFYIGSYLSMGKLWTLLKPHQQNRFLVFWDPEYDLNGAGYNLYQSKIAIGSGGFLGKGFGQGTQSRLRFLPESHTDFTFAVLAEDWGFLGCIVFFFLFLMLIYLCLEIARESRNVEGSLLAGGIGIYFLTHFAINVGMAMGMLPVAGLPLSFLSYGGSHLLACLIGLGLVLNVKLRRFQ
jgi:rod shape determining protein RodA